MKSKPPVIIVRSNYTPYGGAETIALDLIEAVLAHTDETICLLTLPGQPWPIRHHRLTIVPLGIARGHRLWVSWAFNHEVCKYIQRHTSLAVFAIDRVVRFTHYHAGGGSHRTFLQFQNQNAKRRQRLFRKFSIYHRFILHLEQKGFNNPDLKKIHCCSRMVAEQLRDLYAIDADKLFVCHNPIDWHDIGRHFDERQRLSEQLTRQFHIDAGVKWLLFLGSGFERKGLDIAIQGLARMPATYHLMVVGDGKSAAFERLAHKYGVAGRIRFMGPQPRGWRFAAICSALVHPSRYEPFGLAVAEAQAMGLPALVSNRTGYSELILPGQSGVILNLDSGMPDFAQAFDGLRHLIEMPCLAPEEIRQNIRHLDNSIVMRKMVHDFLELPPGDESPVAIESEP